MWTVTEDASSRANNEFLFAVFPVPRALLHFADITSGHFVIGLVQN